MSNTNEDDMSITRDNLKRFERETFDSVKNEGWYIHRCNDEFRLIIVLPISGISVFNKATRIRLQIEPVKSITEQFAEELRCSTISVEMRENIVRKLQLLLDAAGVDL